MRRAQERAGLRLGLALAGGLGVALVVLPLGVLVRDDWGPLRRADLSGVRQLELSGGLLRDVALVLTQLGSPLLLELTASLLVVWLAVRSRRRLALFLLLTVFGAQIVSATSKQAVARIRPCVAELAGCPDSLSFPSGHSVGAAAFWTAVAVLLLPRVGRAAWALAVAVPLVVGITRLQLGVHFPSDVLAGLLIGWAWAAAMTAVFVTWRQEENGRDVPLEAGLEDSGTT